MVRVNIQVLANERRRIYRHVLAGGNFDSTVASTLASWHGGHVLKSLSMQAYFPTDLGS